MTPLQAADPPLVLASRSVARAQLLRGAGLVFETLPAAIDEQEVKRSVESAGASVESAAITLAELKAQASARRRPEALVIGADQILICDGVWYDKPATMAIARDQLLSLRGRRHTLATAVVCWRGGRRVWHSIAAPTLVMRNFSEEFLDTYLAIEGQPVLASVGAYRLEGLGVHLFDAVLGPQAAILGLPLVALLGFLRQHGVILT